MKSRSPSSWSHRLLLGALLISHMLVQVVLAGFSTAWFIVRSGERPQGGLLRMTYEDIDDTGAVVLACLLSLTPGSTTVDLDIERRELLVHVLDASQLEQVVARTRSQLEARLQGVFMLRSER